MSSRTLGLLAAAVVSFATGCAASHQQQIDAHAATQLQAEELDAEQNVILVHCANGKDLGPGCGLLLPHVSTPEFRSAFKEKKCSAKSAAECQDLFDRAVDASLSERYWAADRDAIAKKCASEPGRCDDNRTLEMDLLTSHNLNARLEIAHRQEAIESEADAAHRADQREATGKTMVLAEMLGTVHHAHY